MEPPEPAKPAEPAEPAEPLDFFVRKKVKYNKIKAQNTLTLFEISFSGKKKVTLKGKCGFFGTFNP